MDDLGGLLLVLFFVVYSVAAALFKKFREGKRPGAPAPRQAQMERQERPPAPPMLELPDLWEEIRRELAEAEAEAPSQPPVPPPTPAELETLSPARESPSRARPTPRAVEHRPRRRRTPFRLSPRTLGGGIVLATVLGRPRALTDWSDPDPVS